MEGMRFVVLLLLVGYASAAARSPYACGNCPPGYECDVSAQSCARRSDLSPPRPEELGRLQPLTKILSGSGAPLVTSEVCPGGETECHGKQTCCMLPSGKYGCCPFHNAVCCSDHVHCCPEGEVCDMDRKECIGGLRSLSSLRKHPSQPLSSLTYGVRIVKNVICPDGQSQCGDEQTCCRIGETAYGCCPHPDAVCCRDHKHCCQRGYTCGDEGCSKDDYSWLS